MKRKKNELVIIEKHAIDKILSLIHFARKAGKIAMGFSAVLKSMHEGKSRMILIAEDISENTLKKIMRENSSLNIPHYIFSDMNTISSSLKINKIALISVDDINFAKGMLKYIR